MFIALLSIAKLILLVIRRFGQNYTPGIHPCRAFLTPDKGFRARSKGRDTYFFVNPVTSALFVKKFHGIHLTGKGICSIFQRGIGRRVYP
jgi:hypothetical protein